MLIAAGILAIIYPVISSAAVVILLGWLLIISGIVQGLSLISARHVPHFWLQLISVIFANLPVTALWLVGFLLGINLISVGAAIAYLAWQVRQS